MTDSISETRAPRPKPVVLCILDGWGLGEAAADNAIYIADTPNWDRYVGCGPTARLMAAAEEVGLPPGQMGNSEVGHMNIGSGRVVRQTLPRIDAAIASGRLAESGPLKKLISGLKATGGVCHLIGLLSPGGVHSHQDHMAALARIVVSGGVAVRVHAFLDGRDVPPKSADGYMEKFLNDIADDGDVAVVTISGRYYAMDRDRRWERVERAYMAVAEGLGEVCRDPRAAIARGYDRGESDEFIAPTVIDGYGGIKDGDAILVANFRADRIRELLSALVEENFMGFSRPRRAVFSALVGMAEYSSDLNRRFQTLFPPMEISATLGEVVSDAGLAQLRIAETEKYAHVTYFFNGGSETPFEGEQRILIPSPKDVETYDQKPQMSAAEVTEALLAQIARDHFDFICVNYANPDMVGHSGILPAAVKAVAAIDQALEAIVRTVLAKDGVVLITADHGNLEQMTDYETGQPHTAHTTFPVPLILVSKEKYSLRSGIHADIAPTILDLMQIEKPSQMDHDSLIGER